MILVGLLSGNDLTASTKNEYGNEVVYNNYTPTPEEAVAQAKAYNQEQERKKLQASLAKKAKANLGANPGNYSCSCVLYAQSIGLGVSGYGAAKNYPVRSKMPSSSGFVVTYESSLGHVAYYVLKDNYLTLQEANYSRCRITSGRVLPVNSPLIKGYI